MLNLNENQKIRIPFNTAQNPPSIKWEGFGSTQCCPDKFKYLLQPKTLEKVKNSLCTVIKADNKSNFTFSIQKMNNQFSLEVDNEKVKIPKTIDALLNGKTHSDEKQEIRNFLTTLDKINKYFNSDYMQRAINPFWRKNINEDNKSKYAIGALNIILERDPVISKVDKLKNSFFSLFTFAGFFGDFDALITKNKVAGAIGYAAKGIFRFLFAFPVYLKENIISIDDWNKDRGNRFTLKCTDDNAAIAQKIICSCNKAAKKIIRYSLKRLEPKRIFTISNATSMRHIINGILGLAITIAAIFYIIGICTQINGFLNFESVLNTYVVGWTLYSANFISSMLLNMVYGIPIRIFRRNLNEYLLDENLAEEQRIAGALNYLKEFIVVDEEKEIKKIEDGNSYLSLKGKNLLKSIFIQKRKERWEIKAKNSVKAENPDLEEKSDEFEQKVKNQVEKIKNHSIGKKIKRKMKNGYRKMEFIIGSGFAREFVRNLKNGTIDDYLKVLTSEKEKVTIGGKDYSKNEVLKEAKKLISDANNDSYSNLMIQRFDFWLTFVAFVGGILDLCGVGSVKFWEWFWFINSIGFLATSEPFTLLDELVKEDSSIKTLTSILCPTKNIIRVFKIANWINKKTVRKIVPQDVRKIIDSSTVHLAMVPMPGI